MKGCRMRNTEEVQIKEGTGPLRSEGNKGRVASTKKWIKQNGTDLKPNLATLHSKWESSHIYKSPIRLTNCLMTY